MTPQQFITHAQKQPLAPAYLFLGPEIYRREGCRKALLDRVLPGDERENGFIRHDLDEVSLQTVLDDASSLSLFASRRVIWASSAESALPAKITSEDDADMRSLAAYMKNPVPDVTLVFDAHRFDLDGYEDKSKVERLRKFYAPIGQQVEFANLNSEAARQFATDLAKREGVMIGPEEIELLVEALGSDAGRIANEIEKLRLYTNCERRVTADDVALLAPNARSATVFNLVSALGRGDRARSLDLLDTLVREGEYLPLALSLVATQFRYALIAKEEGLRSPQQIQSHFQRLGIQMWSSRAQQVYQTLSAFPADRIDRAMRRLFLADKACREAHPDDRVVIEALALALTS